MSTFPLNELIINRYMICSEFRSAWSLSNWDGRFWPQCCHLLQANVRMNEWALLLSFIDYTFVNATAAFFTFLFTIESNLSFCGSCLVWCVIVFAILVRLLLLLRLFIYFQPCPVSTRTVWFACLFMAFAVCFVLLFFFFNSKHDGDNDEEWMWLVRQTDAQSVHSNTLSPLLVRFQFRFYDGAMFFSTSFVLMNLTAERLRINSIVIIVAWVYYLPNDENSPSTAR